MQPCISHSLKAVKFKKGSIIQCFLNNTFFKGITYVREITEKTKKKGI